PAMGATYDALASPRRAIAERPIMLRLSQQSRFVLVVTLPCALMWGACGTKFKTHSPAKSLPSPPVQSAAETLPLPEVVRVEDPITTLIGNSNRHFQAGEEALQLGHVEAAKQEFNRAIGVLLESPYGGRTEPSLREHFDRLVDRISTYEVRALAEGDGFAEKKYEPASIDALLSVSTTFGTPAARPALKDVVAADLLNVSHDVPIPLNQRVLAYIEMFQGR